MTKVKNPAVERKLYVYDEVWFLVLTNILSGKTYCYSFISADEISPQAKKLMQDYSFDVEIVKKTSTFPFNYL